MSKTALGSGARIFDLPKEQLDPLVGGNGYHMDITTHMAPAEQFAMQSRVYMIRTQGTIEISAIYP
jgi:hypothetical protein